MGYDWDISGGRLPAQRMERDIFGALMGCPGDISPLSGRDPPYSNAFFSLRAMAVRLSCAEERMLAVPHS